MIKVLIVHPNRLTCEAIAASLTEAKDMTVIGYATSVTEALPQLANCQVMLASARLPQDGALELAQAAVQLKPDVKALIMELPESDKIVLKYVEAGAAGYVPRKELAEDLLVNIRAAYNNQALISPHVAAALISRITELTDLWYKNDSRPYEAFDLTPREREVLELIAQGWSNRQIAEELVVEVGTVKNHVHNILKKLDLSSRRDIANYVTAMNNTQ
jgi:DNA-binding NarL/FixJ family response regulator